MAITQYPSSSFGIGQTVTTTNGTFTIDCSSATDFLLDFNTSYYTSPSTLTPVYVGGKATGFPGTSVTPAAFSLTDLSGGIDTKPSEGDVVIVAYAITGDGGGGADITDVNVVGYTELTELFVTDTNAINLGVYYKRMEAIPDTSITLSDISSTGLGYAVAVHVWRNIDPYNPFDATRTTATAASSALANPPSITTTTANAIVLAIGAAATDNGTALFTQGGDLSNFVTASGNGSSEDAQIGIGSILKATPGAVDPIAFSTTQNTDNSWAAVTVALRKIQYNNIATIDLTNIPTQIKDFNVFSNTAGLTLSGSPITLSWDTSIKQVQGLPRSISSNSSFISNFFSYSGEVFSINKNYPQKIQKVKYITSTESWSVPSDVSEVDLLICGGGGGGAAGGTDVDGGGGSVDVLTLSVSPGSTYVITIGAGGAAGSDGGTSSFGSIFSLSGGISSGNGAGKGGNAGNGTLVVNAEPGINGFGAGGAGGTADATGYNAAPNTGRGGSPNGSGGSGICIIKYWSSY